MVLRIFRYDGVFLAWFMSPAHVKGKPVIHVFLPIWYDPVTTIGKHAFITEMIAAAGYQFAILDLEHLLRSGDELLSAVLGVLHVENRPVALREQLLQKPLPIDHGKLAEVPAIGGEQIEEPSIPASFRVLVKELQSLGLAVEAVNEGGDVIRFGKDEEKVHPPKLETGLLGLGEDLMQMK